MPSDIKPLRMSEDRKYFVNYAHRGAPAYCPDKLTAYILEKSENK